MTNQNTRVFHECTERPLADGFQPAQLVRRHCRLNQRCEVSCPSVNGFRFYEGKKLHVAIGKHARP
jgi:hypothetical protein